MPTGVYEHKRGYRTGVVKRPAFRVIGPSIGYVPLTHGMFAIIDAEDVERVSQWSWAATNLPQQVSQYARATEKILETGGTRSFVLHRFLLNFPAFHVDHKNGNGFHCWKANLRQSDPVTNQYNSRLSKRNTSGYKGVALHPQGWLARTSVNGKRLFCGIHVTKEAAAEAVRKARELYHGEFVNHG